MTENAQAALFAALAKAQAAARAVEKDATNKFHRYNYTSAEGMIAEAKLAMSQFGLAVFPISAALREPHASELPSKDDGDLGKGARCVLSAAWLVVHELGGQQMIECEWPVIPEKGRPLDKALAAARTASLNYLLRDLLQLPRVEEGTDLDHDSRDQPQQRREQAPPPPKPDDSKAFDVARIIATADEKTLQWALGEIAKVTDESTRGKQIAFALQASIERRSAALASTEWRAIDNTPAAKELHERKVKAAAWLSAQIA